MRAKKLLTAALAAMMSLGIMSVDINDTQAATRAELGAISVSKKGNFKYWEKDSEAKAALVNYVKDVTNPRSKNFIPVEDRIAVFDLDGTLICETAPYYFEWMFYIHHDLNEPNHRATPAARKTAQEILDAIYAHKMTLELDEKERYGQAASFEGMTPEEYAAYVKNYMNTTYVEGLSNLKTGEGFYMPMVEVVSYLNANKFTCYIVSGSERDLLRVLVDGVMDIEPNHIIGTDHTYTTANIDGNRPDRFFLKPDDQLLRGGGLLELRLQTNKVYAIKREIGKQPVLAFGNSMGDSSMFTYTITNNKYKSAAFMILADDTVRELGNPSKAEKIKATADQYGWTTISMRDDWKTIYGDGVERVE
ncbi:MAG: haloacid dehalogenase-like hydrolase [Selenomonadaceae bacterium]|nr:haloacid dehalogenase-like hydrolase [Selenomonadaceae bacterium]